MLISIQRSQFVREIEQIKCWSSLQQTPLQIYVKILNLPNIYPEKSDKSIKIKLKGTRLKSPARSLFKYKAILLPKVVKKLRKSKKFFASKASRARAKPNVWRQKFLFFYAIFEKATLIIVSS